MTSGSNPPRHPNAGPAVADEDPDKSRMDQPEKREEKDKGHDMPGADGPSGAGAEEDTYD